MKKKIAYVPVDTARDILHERLASRFDADPALFETYQVIMKALEAASEGFTTTAVRRLTKRESSDD